MCDINTRVCTNKFVSIRYIEISDDFTFRKLILSDELAVLHLLDVLLGELLIDDVRIVRSKEFFAKHKALLSVLLGVLLGIIHGACRTTLTRV